MIYEKGIINSKNRGYLFLGLLTCFLLFNCKSKSIPSEEIICNEGIATITYIELFDNENVKDLAFFYWSNYFNEDKFSELEFIEIDHNRDTRLWLIRATEIESNVTYMIRLNHSGCVMGIGRNN